MCFFSMNFCISARLTDGRSLAYLLHIFRPHDDEATRLETCARRVDDYRVRRKFVYRLFYTWLPRRVSREVEHRLAFCLKDSAARLSADADFIAERLDKLGTPWTHSVL